MTGTSATSEKIPVHVYGGPVTLIEYGGLRFVTDPTFDPPGEHPVPLPGDHRLVKAAPPPVTAADLGRQRTGIGLQTAELKRPDGTVTVTGVPARHGPVGCVETAFAEAGLAHRLDFAR